MEHKSQEVFPAFRLDTRTVVTRAEEAVNG